MRKFARCIGSEGKSQGNRGDQCPLLFCRVVDVCAGLGLYKFLRATDLRWKATDLRGRQNLLPLAPAYSSRGARKIANSELLTAGNPTV
jgi:hypothetical protein